MLSHGACGDSQKAQVPGRTGHPQPPTLVTQAYWALLGGGGICSPKAPTPSVGGAGCGYQQGHHRKCCSWASPGCSGPWDGVACCDCPSKRGVAHFSAGPGHRSGLVPQATSDSSPSHPPLPVVLPLGRCTEHLTVNWYLSYH